MIDSTWRSPRRDHILLDGEVHVWRAGIDQRASKFAPFQQILAADEQARADRFHFERDRHRYIVARGILRTLLGSYLNLAAVDVRFVYNEYGKPSLDPALRQNDLHFNVSHSGDLALFAIARHAQVGVDIEFIRSNIEYGQIAQRFFSPEEQHALSLLPVTEIGIAFFRCWTRKEAYIKARGQGLSIPLDQFTVSLGADEPASLLHYQNDPQEAARWSLYDLAPGAGYAAALAVEAHHRQVRSWDWSSGLQ
jgi:4'-phosphopantetheinyl transferase